MRSAHDCAEGGIAIALAESCLGGQLGATITFDLSDESLSAVEVRWDRWLFGEGGARILVSVLRSRVAEWEAYLQTCLGTEWQAIGQVATPTDPLRIQIGQASSAAIDLDLDALGERWHRALERQLENSAKTGAT